jgi:hypothetical protein
MEILYPVDLEDNFKKNLQDFTRILNVKYMPLTT